VLETPAGRIKGRCQLTTDGMYGYLGAVYDTFGANVDFAQQAKTYSDNLNAYADERRYSVSKGCKTVKTTVHIGKPNPALNQHQPCRTHEFEREIISTPLYPADIGLFKEAGELETFRRVVYRAFQFLPCSLCTQTNAGNERGIDESRLDSRRTFVSNILIHHDQSGRFVKNFTNFLRGF